MPREWKCVVQWASTQISLGSHGAIHQVQIICLKFTVVSDYTRRDCSRNCSLPHEQGIAVGTERLEGVWIHTSWELPATLNHRICHALKDKLFFCFEVLMPLAAKNWYANHRLSVGGVCAWVVVNSLTKSGICAAAYVCRGEGHIIKYAICPADIYCQDVHVLPTALLDASSKLSM